MPLFTFLHKFLQRHTLSFILDIWPRSRTAWSYGRAMFNGLRNCQAVFQSSYAIVHSLQQGRRVPISPLSCQYIFILTNSDSSLPSECWSGIFSKLQWDLFMCLVAIWIFSLQKCTFRCFAPYWLVIVLYIHTHTLITYKSLIRKITFLKYLFKYKGYFKK